MWSVNSKHYRLKTCISEVTSFLRTSETNKTTKDQVLKLDDKGRLSLPPTSKTNHGKSK